MCGLVGMAGNFFSKHQKMMKFLLIFDTLRGPHSTGFASVDKDRKIDLFRKTIPGWDFAEEPMLERIMRMQDRVWMGHNRFATIGKINRLNAHPFAVMDEDDDVQLVGAHNGTIQTRSDIDNAFEFGTDSEALLNMIYHKGAKDSIASVAGAWALTWYDRRADSLNFLRNDERPLYFCYVNMNKNDHEKDRRDTIAWASEIWMLEVAAERADLFISPVYYFDENILYSFDVPKQQGDDWRFREEGGLRGKAKENFTRQAYNGYSAWAGHTNGWRANHSQKWNSETKTWEKAEEEPKKEEEVKTDPSSSSNVTKMEDHRPGKDNQKSTGGSENNTGTRGEETRNPVLEKSNSTTNSQTSSNIQQKSSGGAGRIRYKAFNGQLLDSDRMDELIKGGCAWCGDKIPQRRNSPLAEHPIHWLAENTVVCTECVNDTHMKPEDYTVNDLVDEETARKRDILTVTKAEEPSKKTTGKKKETKTVKKGGLTQKEIDDAINGKKIQEAARSVK